MIKKMHWEPGRHPAGGAYIASPDPLAGLRGGREGKRRGGETGVRDEGRDA